MHSLSNSLGFPRTGSGGVDVATHGPACGDRLGASAGALRGGRPPIGGGPRREAATTTKIKLTDLQLALLSAAPARPDFMLLPPPESMRAKGKTLQRTLARLPEIGLVEEVAARHDAETWRGTDDGRGSGLRIVSAGLEAIGQPMPTEKDADDAEPAIAAPLPKHVEAGAPAATNAGPKPADANAAPAETDAASA